MQLTNYAFAAISVLGECVVNSIRFLLEESTSSANYFYDILGVLLVITEIICYSCGKVSTTFCTTGGS